MTFIIDMASGTEYRGEEMHCESGATGITSPCVLHHLAEKLDLRLETVEAGAPRGATTGLPAGLQIDALIQSLED